MHLAIVPSTVYTHQLSQHARTIHVYAKASYAGSTPASGCQGIIEAHKAGRTQAQASSHRARSPARSHQSHGRAQESKVISSDATHCRTERTGRVRDAHAPGTPRAGMLCTCCAHAVHVLCTCRAHVVHMLCTAHMIRGFSEPMPESRLTRISLPSQSLVMRNASRSSRLMLSFLPSTSVSTSRS